MRLNFFLGVQHSHHLIRGVLKDDERVTSPVLPIYRLDAYNDRSLYDAIKRIGFSKPLLELMFNDLTKEEGNIGWMQWERNIFDDLLNASPTGTRFWFFKPKKIQELTSSHYEFASKYKDDVSIIRSLNFRKVPLTRDTLHDLFNERIKYFSLLANGVGASKWVDFNLKDYFEDGVDNPVSNVEVALYTKSLVNTNELKNI